MRKPKRILSLALSIVLILGLLPVSAMAKEVNTLVLNAVCLFSGTEGETTEFTFTTGAAGVYRFDLKDTNPKYHGGHLSLYSGSDELETYSSDIFYPGDMQPQISQSWNLSADTTYRLVHEPDKNFITDTTHHYSLKPTYVGAPVEPTLSAGQSAQINFLNVGYACEDRYLANFNVRVAASGFYRLDSANGSEISEWGQLPTTVYFKSGKDYSFGVFNISQSNDTLTLTAVQVDCKTLTETAPVSLTESSWISFTAPSAGTYCFKAQDSDGYLEFIKAVNDETFGLVYQQEELIQELEHFSMQSGETVYFYVNHVTPSTGQMSVTKTGGSTEPEPTPETLTLVSSSPANGAVGFNKNDGLTLTFSQDISKNPDWTKGSIYIKNYETDLTVLTIDGATFHDLRGTINGATMTIPLALKSLGDAKYYILIDENVIDVKDAVDGVVATYDGISNKNVLTFQFRIPEAPIKKGQNGETFTYISQFLPKRDNEASYDYSYDESWFLKSGTEYQHDLARMSIRMAMAAARTTPVSIKDLFDQLGFSYSDASIDYPTPTKDSIGYAIGSKRILDENGREFTLVAVAVRGGGYEDEWASNFTVGTGSEHQGFAEAGEKVADNIEQYISNFGGARNIKVWITGYSRAAATANIAAQRLNERVGRINGLSTDGIYAYCFECPQGARTTSAKYKEVYGNIHNIVNDFDIVTKVAPKDSLWNYNRYGISYQIPSPGLYPLFSVKSTEMLNHYTDIIKKAYISAGADISDSKARNMAQDHTNQLTSQGLAGDFIVSTISQGLVSPGAYTAVAQDSIRSYAAKYLGSGDADVGDFLMALVTFVGSSGIINNTSLGGAKQVALVDAILLHAMNIKYAHYPELCLAWMDTIDGAGGFADLRTRKLYVNCPVDVSVYDSSDKLVAQIINNSAENSPADGIPAFVDFDGQKIIMLPSDEEYRVELAATGSGEMTYMVSEYDVNDGSTDKLVSYHQISIAAGDAFTGTVENLEQTSDAQYPLEGASGAISPTVKQQGDDVKQYGVTVKTSGNGAAYGGGYYLNGEYTKLTAVPNNGESFLGWYVNEALISADPEYRMMVAADTEIVAKFTSTKSESNGHSSGSTTYDVTVKNSKNGTVTADRKTASSGSTVTLTISPEQGWTLETLTVTNAGGKEIDLNIVKAGEKYTFKMPSSNVTVAATFMEDNSILNSFVDVPSGSYYYDAVLWAVKNSITAGTDAIHFSPDGICTRAQAVTFLWRAAGSPAPKSATMPFTDVPAGSYYYNAVLWAVENDITKGTSDTAFSPDKTCTRAQIVTFLWRSQNAPAAGSSNPFTDVAAGDYYADAVLWAVKNDITKGTGATTFSPDADCTRAQIVTFLWRTLA